MKVTGDAILQASAEEVWRALLDPNVLVQAIPGCERLVATGPHSYDVTVTAGVASVKGTYAGSCELSDLTPHESLVMRLDASGAPGTVAARVNVGFADLGGGTTRLTYDADATVGGAVGGVGQRLLASVSRRMAGEFFGNVDAVLSGLPVVGAPVAPTAAGAGAPVAAGQVFTPPAKPASALGARQDLLTGIAIGAGLVLAGVVVGGLFGRRRG
jgi:carbon monoxide dehydrogenase subunit G